VKVLGERDADFERKLVFDATGPHFQGV